MRVCWSLGLVSEEAGLAGWVPEPLSVWVLGDE